MTRLQNTVAAIAIAAVLACVAAIYLAGKEIYRTIGPSKAFAAADGRLYLVSHGRVHVFGRDGKRRNAYDLDALGASPTPSDLAVHRDGRIVVASPDGSDLRRCTLPAGPCETLDPRLTGVPLQHMLPLNSVKIAIDEDRGRYFLSDNAGHRLVETDLAGKPVASTPARTVWYPNQLTVEAPGRLRVVDTNHRRIATFSVVGDSIGPLVGEMATDARDIARPGREWPFDSVRSPSGETWALVAAEGMKDADLIVYGGDGHARRRIDLGSDSDPFDIELWGDRVIVSDATNYRVEAVGLDGRRLRAFDDPDFDKELAAARERPQWWRTARLAAQIGIIAVPLLAIVALRLLGVPMGIKLETSAPQVPREGATRLTSDVRWVELSPGYPELARRRMKRGIWFQLAIFLAFFATQGLVFGDQVYKDPKLQQILWMFGAIIAIFILVIFLALKNPGKQFEGYRIGASTSGLRYELPKFMAPFGMRREGRAPWRDVYYDGRRLLADTRVLMLKTPQGVPLFGDEELRTVVLANVPMRNVVSRDKLMLLQLRSPRTWVMIAIAVAVVAWQLSRTFV